MKQKGGFLDMLLGTFDVSLLGSTLAGKGVLQAGVQAIGAVQGF